MCFSSRVPAAVRPNSKQQHCAGSSGDRLGGKCPAFTPQTSWPSAHIPLLTDERLNVCAGVATLGASQLVLLAAAVAAGRAGRLADGGARGEGPPQAGHAQ